MEEFENLFKQNYTDAISKEEAIFKGEKYRITVLSELLVRLEYSESGSFEDRPTELAKFRNFDVPKFEVYEDDKVLNIKTSYFDLNYTKNKPMLGAKMSPDQNFKVDLVGTTKTWFFTQAEARNFKSIASSLEGTTTMPKLEKGLYSTDGFVSLDDSKNLIFNEDGSVGIRRDERIDTYLFMYKKDFGYCLRDYYKLTGYPPLIPRYALGIWWNKDEMYNTDSLYSLLSKFKKNGIPLSILLLNNWTKNDISFDPNAFVNPKSLVDGFHENQVKIGLRLNLDKIPASNNGVSVEVPFNVYDKNFLMTYLETFVKPMLDIGIDLFSLSYTGKDMKVLRMLNHFFYRYLNHSKRGLMITKNGLISSHLYPVYDSGKTLVDWKVFSLLPEFNSTSSNIGVSWWSHAIGGFEGGVEDSELYTRYIEFATYSPIFRLSSKAGTYYKREPWKWDVKTLSIVKDYCRLRHSLIPYLYSEARKYAKTGLPLLQPLYYRYPELYDEPNYKNEYYFGTEFFVVPITSKKDAVMNRTITKMFLPNGIWYDFKTGKKFPGGKRYISFFRDEDYPVFAKQGAIIPLAILDDENLNDTKNPRKLEIHIFPGKTNNFQLYEDDGISNNYKDGNYLTTVIDYNYLPNNYTVIIRPLEGKPGVIPEKRDYKIRFRNTRYADDVIVYLGKDPIECKKYLDDQDFIVEVKDASTAEQLSINCKGKDIEIDAVRLINEDVDTIISDLKISTTLKEKIADIMFSEEDIKKKRIAIKKMASQGLPDIFIKMFLKLLEYISEF